LIKKQWMIPLSALLTIGLSGCATNDQAEGDKNHNAARPIGYYSNENHKNNRSGWPADNDGPVPELMDHSLGLERTNANSSSREQLQARNENGYPPNPTTPLANEDRFFRRDNRYSTSDANYHGHVNQSRNMNVGTDTTTPEAQDRMTEQIRRRAAEVDHVEHVRSVVYANDVIVSVEIDSNGQTDQIKRNVEKAVKPYVNGKNVQVMIDEGALGRNRNHRNGEQHLDHNGDR
jgi:spore cortex protein